MLPAQVRKRGARLRYSTDRTTRRTSRRLIPAGATIAAAAFVLGIVSGPAKATPTLPTYAGAYIRAATNGYTSIRDTFIVSDGEREKGYGGYDGDMPEFDSNESITKFCRLTDCVTNTYAEARYDMRSHKIGVQAQAGSWIREGVREAKFDSLARADLHDTIVYKKSEFVGPNVTIDIATVIDGVYSMQRGSDNNGLAWFRLVATIYETRYEDQQAVKELRLPYTGGIFAEHVDELLYHRFSIPKELLDDQFRLQVDLFGLIAVEDGWYGRFQNSASLFIDVSDGVEFVRSGSGFAPRSFQDYQPTEVTEPGSLILLASGLAGVFLMARRSPGSFIRH